MTTFVPPARPTAIAAHPDQPVVVLGGRDGSLSWWDARSGHCLGRVQAHDGRVRALALTHGTDLVMSVSQDGTAAVRRLHDRGPVGRFMPPTPSGPRELTHVAGTPDGRCWLIGGRAGQVHVLHWSGHARLVPQRVGRPSWAMDGGDVALGAFPFPARADADHWWRDETTKYRLMYALRQAGASAARTLLAVFVDDEIYRDTRHRAEVTLQAIGLPRGGLGAGGGAASLRRRHQDIPGKWRDPRAHRA